MPPGRFELPTHHLEDGGSGPLSYGGKAGLLLDIACYRHYHGASSSQNRPCTPGRDRTDDPRIKSSLLLPTELRRLIFSYTALRCLNHPNVSAVRRRWQFAQTTSHFAISAWSRSSDALLIRLEMSATLSLR